MRSWIETAVLNRVDSKSRTRRRAALWLVVAGMSLLLAAVLSPHRIVTSLPPKAERFRESLESGVAWVRYALAGCGVLAVLSAFWWKPGNTKFAATEKSDLKLSDWAFALLLLIIAICIRAIAINSSLFWDEIRTMLVVRNGLPTVLTYSAAGNNHVLNSILIWLTRRFAGEGEFQVRLPAYVLGIATPPAFYLLWAGVLGRRTAGFAGLAALAHFSLQIHATEARGYAGAVFFVCVAQAFFARLVEEPTPARIVCYVASCVASIGFIPVAILVPVANGFSAAILFAVTSLRGKPVEARDTWKTAWFSTVWAVLLAMIAFGLPMPQTLSYALHGAERDHLLLSLGLISQIGDYLSGTPAILATLAVFALCITGWALGKSSPAVRLAFLAPVALAAIWLLGPHGRYSDRLFFFLLPAVIMGIALGCEYWGSRPGRAYRVLPLAAVCIWLICMMPGYWRRYHFGNPDLRGQARALRSSHVILCGMQSDVNSIYYFHNAPFIRSWTGTAEQIGIVRDADVVIEGFQVIDRDTHPQQLRNLGFVRVENLESWNPSDRVNFLVYRREASLSHTHSDR
jgi:hypothetical protein